MEKRNFVVILIIISAFGLILGGCQKSSDHFLSYQEELSSSEFDLGNFFLEHDFFSKDLVIIPGEGSSGHDELINSEAALLIDITKGETLYSKNVYEKLYPASLTKLVTALVALQRGELTDSITISYNASHISESGAKLCGFEEGDILNLDTLLHCMLVYSGNDAALAIAEHLAGSEEDFVKLMNDEAVKIGAIDSNFMNSHGLHDDNQYTTAYDIYLFFNKLIQNDTFRSIVSMSSYTAEFTDKDGNPKEKTFNTTNQYLLGNIQQPDNTLIIGGKSGTTSKAGNCLILLSQGATGTDYISLVLKAADKEQLYSEIQLLISETAY